MVLRTRRARLHLLASRTHKWLAIVIGIQLFLWFASGTLMSFLPVAKLTTPKGIRLADATTGVLLPPVTAAQAEAVARAA